MIKHLCRNWTYFKFFWIETDSSRKWFRIAQSNKLNGLEAQKDFIDPQIRQQVFYKFISAQVII